jgi:hypothetical protein
MQAEDENAKRRSRKLSALLVGLEDYVNEVVMSNHGMKHEEMVRIVQDNFNRSIQANVDFHGEMARLEKDDVAFESYHKVMADAYRSLLK